MTNETRGKWLRTKTGTKKVNEKRTKKATKEATKTPISLGA